MLSRLLTRKEQAVLLIFAASIVLGTLVILFSGGHPAPATDRPDLTFSLSESPDASAPIVIPDEPETKSEPDESVVSPPADLPPEFGAPRGLIQVAIRGAVNAPGVYTFHVADRVQTALKRAGGVREEADLNDINLAARLIDGTTLYIPVGRFVRVEEDRISVRSGTNAPGLNPPQYTLSGWRPEFEAVPGSSTHSPVDDSGRSGRINVNRASADELATLPGIGPVLSQSIIQHRRNQPFTTVEELRQVHGIGEKRLETLRPLVTVR